MIILSPFHSVCLSYGLNVSSKTYVEGLALIVAWFGHGASKEIIQIKWSHKGWESPDPIGLLYYEKRHQRVCSLSLNAIWECNEKLGICKPGRETSPETDPAAAAAAKSLQSCSAFCNSIDCGPSGSSLHGIFQARILEWVAISFSRGSSRPRDWTWVSCVSCIAGRFFTPESLGKRTWN